MKVAYIALLAMAVAASPALASRSLQQTTGDGNINTAASAVSSATLAIDALTPAHDGPISVTATSNANAVTNVALGTPTITPIGTPAATQGGSPAATKPPPTPSPTPAATPSPTPPSTPTPTPRPITEIDILNFALNLEYLEANFYACAATGKPIDKALWLGGPAPTGCFQGAYTNATLAFMAELAANEVMHVVDIQKLLGSAAISMPQIELDAAFSAAFNAVFKVQQLVPAFNYTKTEYTAYASAFLLEDVGVTAYYGAIDKIANKTLLKAAAGILPVEAYHAGAIRKTLFDNSTQMDTYTYGNTKGDVINAAAALRDSISQSVLATPGGTDAPLYTIQSNGQTQTTVESIFPVSAGALVFERTTAQVISIVTLNATNHRGGWFPGGLNGYII